MELNKKILKYGLVGITIILIILIGSSNFIKLAEPVFLKSYIEERVSIDVEYHQPIELQLRYITNAYDDRKVNFIEFINEENNTSNLSGARLYDKSDSYGLYNVNTLGIEVNRNEIEKDLDRLEFSQVKVTFNNGDTQDVDLGRIVLHRSSVNDAYFGNGSSTSSSDGTSSSEDIVKQEIKLLRLESLLFQDAKDFYDIKIEDKDYKDIAGTIYKEGDSLRVDTSFKTPEDILDRYTQYELQPRLYFEDSKGRELYTNIFNIRHIPYEFKFLEIFKYLRLRGEF